MFQTFIDTGKGRRMLPARGKRNDVYMPYSATLPEQ
jgi:hypothetical protein